MNDLQLPSPQNERGKKNRSPRQSRMVHLFEMLVLCAVGFYLILHPGESLTTAVTLLGIGLVVCGGIAIAAYFFAAERTGQQLGIAVLGVLGVIAGIIVLIKPAWVIAIFPVVSGTLVAFSGVLNLAKAVEVKREGKRGWKVLLALSSITILIGVLIFANPFSFMSTLVVLVGAVLLYNGVLGIVAAIAE